MAYLRIRRFCVKPTRKAHLATTTTKEPQPPMPTLLPGTQLTLFRPMAYVTIDTKFPPEHKDYIATAVDKIDSHIRTGAFHPKTVFAALQKSTGSVKTYQSWNLLGVPVTVTPKRLFAFRNNLKCVCCGLQGEVFIAERHVNDVEAHQYLNLYGINDSGELVLLTVDHILPDSYGGRYHDSNFQTMCSPCNMKKNNTMTNAEIQQVLLDKSAHAKDWVNLGFLHALLRLHLVLNDTEDARERHAINQQLARFRKVLAHSTEGKQYEAATQEIKTLLVNEKVLSSEVPLDLVFDRWSILLSLLFSWAR